MLIFYNSFVWISLNTRHVRSCTSCLRSRLQMTWTCFSSISMTMTLHHKRMRMKRPSNQRPIELGHRASRKQLFRLQPFLHWNTFLWWLNWMIDSNTVLIEKASLIQYFSLISFVICCNCLHFKWTKLLIGLKHCGRSFPWVIVSTSIQDLQLSLTLASMPTPSVLILFY